MNILKTLSVFAVAGLIFTSCGESKKENTTTQEMETSVEDTSSTMAMNETSEPNIVEVAVGNENFTTLVAAVKAADLVETLSGTGPFTVFAPTNDAFAKLPEGTVETLLKPENKSKLSGILTYHVVSGKFEAAAVIDAIKKNNGKFTVDTVNGGAITLSLNGDKVMLTDANGGTSTVVMADVAASNGVIHAIDSVVMPK
ncbi:putative surface protein with fasciclin (FAS1) repeats [Gelidibacter algens]|uniref:Putative surface protein with fasciclin (FAS1) repeats n=1 Tax=Gelidibacter algens TaxID=49280 RepID=A0A327SCE2_9FLAO|nr:fasciclin domain-containing protein [Gelidibacter algens]RAJ26690.1 putative surface protein with fasciclin (FAS1) repeats [Gelidibacter algens]